MNRFQLSVLGGFDLSRAGRPVGIHSAKQRALLTILALADPRPVSRAQLIGLLWASRFDEQARQSLRQALSRLRAALEDECIFTTEGDMIGLSPNSLDCDATRFRQLAREEGVEPLKEAVALYRGEFLADLSIREEEFEDWRAATAGELREAALAACIRLSQAAGAAGDLQEAVEAAQKAVSLDELREDAHRALIAALAAAGRRADAIRHGLQLEAMLRKELGTGVDAQTRTLIEGLRRQESEPAAQPGAKAPPPQRPAAPAAPREGHLAPQMPPGVAERPQAPIAGPSPQPAAAAGERREITALSYQLAGSTELLSRTDLDDFSEISRSLHDHAAEAINARGGFVRQLMGEGGIAFFGYPTPEEDAAGSAVAAGLEIVRRCGALRSGLKQANLRVQIGIATSPAIIEEQGDGSDRVSIVGLAPTLASALLHHADDNTVLVAESTWEHAHRTYRFEYVGALQIKGLAESEKVWRAVGRRFLVDRFSASANWMAPMVARSMEISVAVDRWQKASSGRGQVMLVEGEPGIGKSRLLREIRREVGTKPGQFQLFQCSPRGVSSMLHPVVDRITTAVMRHEPRETALNFAAVERLLRRGGLADSEAIETLSFLVGAHGPAEDRLRDEPPQKIREHALQCVRRCLHDMSSQGPLLLAAEDIHWADPTSQDMLVDLMEWVHERPILAVLSSRSPSFEDWRGEPYVTQVTLNRLGLEDAQQLMQATWDHENLGALPREAVEVIYRRTDGVPLFVEELTRWLADNRRSGDQDWERLLTEAGAATLSNLLSARLGALGDAKLVAQVAAVIGRKFDSVLLGELLAEQRSEAELGQGLQELMKAGLTRRTALGRRVGYAFRHALVQETAYGSLLRRDRQRLHGRIYQSVAADPEKAVWMDRIALAQHADRGGLLADAARLYIQAGKESSARSALTEARQLLESALSLASQLDDGDARERLDLSASAALGPVLTATEGVASPRASQLYERAMEIARRRPIAEQAEWFPIYWGWWFTGSDFGVQSRRAQAILNQLRGVQDDEVQLQVRHCIWAIDFNLGRHDSCLCAIDEGLRLYRPDRGSEHRTLYGGHDARLCALGQRGLALWLTGRGVSAAQSIAEARSWARDTGHVSTIAHALDFRAMFDLYRRDAPALVGIAAEMTEFAGQHGLPSLDAKALIFRGWAEAWTGEPRRGREMIERGFAIQQEIEMQVDFPVYREMLAEICGRCDDPERGLRLVAEAIDEVHRTSHFYWLPELHRRRTKLLRQSGRPAGEVAESIEAALSVAAEQNARMLLMRSYLTALDLELKARSLERWRPQMARALEEMEYDEESEGAAKRIKAAWR